MFAKLLKHEWQAIRGVIGLLCVIILISGTVLGGISYYLVTVKDHGNLIVVNVVCVMLLAAGIIAIAVCAAGSLFYVIYRFYRRCFTDEGYLTFTLPVTNHQILLSSITTCVLSELLTLIAAITASSIAALFFLAAIVQGQEIIWTDLWMNWADLWQQLVDSLWKNINQFAIMGFSCIVGVLAELIILMLAVTIGSLIARKHKILASVGVYYGIYIIQSVVFTTLALYATTSQNVNFFLAAPGIMGIFLGIGGYFLMYWLTSRKLNLT